MNPLEGYTGELQKSDVICQGWKGEERIVPLVYTQTLIDVT
jgi:hypothetical protein